VEGHHAGHAQPGASKVSSAGLLASANLECQIVYLSAHPTWFACRACSSSPTRANPTSSGRDAEAAGATSTADRSPLSPGSHLPFTGYAISFSKSLSGCGTKSPAPQLPPPRAPQGPAHLFCLQGLQQLPNTSQPHKLWPRSRSCRSHQHSRQATHAW
jgi:hypothetical protein